MQAGSGEATIPRHGASAPADLGLAPADDATAYPPIADYAIIGDCRTVALISRQGSVDWLCLPQIYSSSVFAALLDRRRGGRFALRPTAPFRTERRYLDGTNILETTFVTATGRARVIDLMPLRSAETHGLEPERELLRIAEGIDGEVELEALYEPRPDYARALPRLVRRGALGWFFEHRGNAFLLGSEMELHATEDGNGLAGRTVLRPGERRRLSLAHATRDMLVVPPLGDAADRRLEVTARWWRDWSAGCRFDHEHRPMVLRSALTLKLLAYGPSGAVVAAATTSLPEAIGGTRNWDYRFCWLRDAATTLRAFTELGFTGEGRAYLNWLLHSTRLTRPRLGVLYDVHGRTNLRQQIMDHLEGYRGSSPVRVGNNAVEQVQHDVYGSAIEAASAEVNNGGRLHPDEQRLLVGFGKVVCDTWRQPDSGIWEVPGPPRQYVHSKVMCWHALETLLRLHAAGQLRAPETLFRRERDALRAAIEAEGFRSDGHGGGSYVGAFGEDWADASLLIMARLGYGDANDPRIAGTADRIWRDLAREGLLLRYLPEVDGLGSEEGTFGICAFWAVELLAMQGRVAEAERVFRRAAALANDVGLLAEEYDPRTGAALGNVPQAFSHAGLISAALALDRAKRKEAAR